MNADGRTSGDRDTSPETLAAELTVAAYPIALRHGRGGLWIDWELEIWVVLVETVKKWARAFSQPEWLSKFEAWQEAFLEELTDSAYRTILSYGIQGSFLEVELGLYRAFRPLIKPCGEGPSPALPRSGPPFGN